MMNGGEGEKKSLQWPLLRLVMAIQVSCSAVTQCDDAWAIQWVYTHHLFIVI